MMASVLFLQNLQPVSAIVKVYWDRGLPIIVENLKVLADYRSLQGRTLEPPLIARGLSEGSCHRGCPRKLEKCCSYDILLISTLLLIPFLAGALGES